MQTEIIVPTFAVAIIGHAPSEDAALIRGRLHSLLRDRLGRQPIYITLATDTGGVGSAVLQWRDLQEATQVTVAIEPLPRHFPECELRREMSLVAGSDAMLVIYRGEHKWGRIERLARQAGCLVRVIRLN